MHVFYVPFIIHNIWQRAKLWMPFSHLRHLSDIFLCNHTLIGCVYIDYCGLSRTHNRIYYYYNLILFSPFPQNNKYSYIVMGCSHSRKSFKFWIWTLLYLLFSYCRQWPTFNVHHISSAMIFSIYCVETW